MALLDLSLPANPPEVRAVLMLARSGETQADGTSTLVGLGWDTIWGPLPDLTSFCILIIFPGGTGPGGQFEAELNVIGPGGESIAGPTRVPHDRTPNVFFYSMGVAADRTPASIINVVNLLIAAAGRYTVTVRLVRGPDVLAAATTTFTVE